MWWEGEGRKEGEKKDVMGSRVRRIKKRADGCSKENSKEKDEAFRREIKSDAVRKTEVVAWVRK